MNAATPRAREVGREELLSLVAGRRDSVRRYLEWALANERDAVDEGEPQLSMRMENRSDIRSAAEAAEFFAERRWGVVVFTCFGSKLGAGTVAPWFRRPVSPLQADAMLSKISFPSRSVGHHRIQSTLTGAKQALVAACADDDFFCDVLHHGEDFDTRYGRLRGARLRQWGRTTCFDLLLRAGALAIGGARCLPDFAYLAGSTGPRKGFAAIFGVPVTSETAPWAEGVLRTWAENWKDVCKDVGVDWEGDPLYPRDQENFLCVYQENRAAWSNCKPIRTGESNVQRPTRSC